MERRSRGTPSEKITDKVVEEMNDWFNRPLDRVYPVIFIDAILVKVRDGQVRNKPMYVIIGVTTGGERDILGIWTGDGGEGAKFSPFGVDGGEEPRRRRRLHRGMRRAQGPSGGDQHRVGAGHSPAVHHPLDPQHLPLRLEEVLGRNRFGPQTGLHRGVGSRGEATAG